MDRVIEVLVDQWLFDIWVLQQWWMWAQLGIPGIAYALFMMAKWGVLTIPLSVPFNATFNGMVRSAHRGWKNADKDA